MKIALLSGASPKTCGDGPIVRLLAGTWRFHLQGIQDSLFALKVGDGHGNVKYGITLQHQKEIEFDEPTAVQLAFDKHGTESYITAFAERI